MRNARKRRMKRHHGNHPAKPRPRSTIKRKLVAPPIALSKHQRPLTLDDL